VATIVRLEPTLGSLGTLRARAQSAPILDVDAEHRLAAAARTGSRSALDQLLVAHLRLVLRIARGYVKHGVPYEDLVGDGMVGLAEAAQRFDPERGVRFSAYAAWWIRAHIRRSTLANRRIVATPSTRAARKLIARLRETERALGQQLGRIATREEVAAALGVTADDVGMVDTALRERDVVVGDIEHGGVELADFDCSPEQLVADAELRADVQRAVNHAVGTLTEREREIVRRRITSDDADTLSVVGQALGLSRERVRQIESKACEKLRTVLEDCAA
jgi:RNA polymerase sigma-32 factor